HDPLCAEFGLRRPKELSRFLSKALGGFSVVGLFLARTTAFEEAKASRPSARRRKKRSSRGFLHAYSCCPASCFPGRRVFEVLARCVLSDPPIVLEISDASRQ
ncbi:unnamed protein product, partial [Phaeothamnion confervicola]